MGFLQVERFLRLYTLFVGLLEAVIGVIGVVAASKQFGNSNKPVITLVESVTVNSYGWSCLWLGLFHILFGLFLVADESKLVPAVRGYMAFLRSSKVKGVVFIFIGLLMLGLADTLGFVFALLVMINGLLHIILGRDKLAWRETSVTSTGGSSRGAQFLENEQ